MEVVLEIESLLDAIDREISLLDRVTTSMSFDLDSSATHDMTRWLGSWDPFAETTFGLDKAFQ